MFCIRAAHVLLHLMKASKHLTSVTAYVKYTQNKWTLMYGAVLSGHAQHMLCRLRQLLSAEVKRQ